MSNWTDDFLKHCLEGVPEGAYRTRAEKELRDHLLSLNRDLEGAGYTPEEACALAQERTGDPAELARRYMREWERRQLHLRTVRVEVLLFELCTVLAGLLYAANVQSFGKVIVIYWSLVSVFTAGFMFSFQHQAVARIGCLILSVIQLPPVRCWMVYGGGIGFEMSGVTVRAWAGVLVHVLLFLWGLANYRIITRFQREERQVIG